MDLDVKDRRGNSLLAAFARYWPYLAIFALLGLHAFNFTKSPSSTAVTPIVRNTLLVRNSQHSTLHQIVSPDQACHLVYLLSCPRKAALLFQEQGEDTESAAFNILHHPSPSNALQMSGLLLP